MSGLEVVGVALGALPLLVEGLRTYRELFKYQKKILPAIRLIVFEEFRLRSTLELILYDTLSSEEIQQLLQDWQSPKWRSPEVETAFRNALGDSGYNEFTQRLQNSVDTLAALKVSISRLTPVTTDITSDSRQSRSLRRRIQWVVRRSGIEKEMEELRRRNQSLDMYVSNSAFGRSVQVRQNLDDALSFFSGMGAITHQVAEEVLQDGHESAYLGDNEDAMSAMTDEDVPVPHEPEPSVEGAKLRYLDVTIQLDEDGTTSESPAPRWPEKAFLDSGANYCIMSVALATKIGVDVKLKPNSPNESELREIHTLVPSDSPSKFHVREAKVNLRWKDKDGGRHRIKISVYIPFVPSLGKNFVLSQEFMDNHKEVWDAATQVPESDMQLNGTFLDRLRSKDKKEQTERLAEIEKKNQLRHEADSSKRQEARSNMGSSDASEAGPSTKSVSDPGPSSTSSGSSQDKG